METRTHPILAVRQRNGHIIKTDLTAVGPMLAYYRERAGLTTTGLAMATTTCSSSTIKNIESGRTGISRRNLALRMAEACKLDPWETDHFLYVAGYAPVLDWQQFARDILVDLGLGSVYEEDSAVLYERESRPTRPRRRATDDH